MGEAGDDLGLDVCLDRGPWLGLFGRCGRDQVSEVSRLDIGKHGAGGKSRVIFDYWTSVSAN